MYGVAKMPFVFSHVEYCDMHFVYGFGEGNARAAVQEYQRRFPDRRIPSRSVFTRINQTLRDTGSLPSVSLQSEREVVRTFNTRENILQMVQRSPRLSTRRMASRIGVSRMQVWRTLHEEDLYEVFLRNELPGLLEDIPLMIGSQMYIQHGGAPPHYNLHVRDYLNESFPSAGWVLVDPFLWRTH